MTPRILLASLALLSLTGCVAALPMAAQLVAGTGSATQLCAMTKIPGQTTSLCDRIGSAVAGQLTIASAPPPRGDKVGTAATTAGR